MECEGIRKALETDSLVVRDGKKGQRSINQYHKVGNTGDHSSAGR